MPGRCHDVGIFQFVTFKRQKFRSGMACTTHARLQRTSPIPTPEAAEEEALNPAQGQRSS